MKRFLIGLTLIAISTSSTGCCCRRIRDFFQQGAYCGPALASPLNLLGPQQPLVGTQAPGGVIPVAPVPAGVMPAAPHLGTAVMAQPMVTGPIMAAPTNICCPEVCCPSDCCGGFYSGYGGECCGDYGYQGSVGGVYPGEIIDGGAVGGEIVDSGTATSSPNTSVVPDTYGGSTYGENDKYSTPNTTPQPGL